MKWDWIFFPGLLHVFLSIQAQPLLAGALYGKAGDHLAKSSGEKITEIISLKIFSEKIQS
jgi:hypothetical protein